MDLIPDLPDSLLVSNYLKGNTNAFTILIHRYKSRIYTSIYLLVKDKYLAEDIFQETFIKVLDKLNSGNYTEEGKFLPWAMRIAHNLCIDHFRKIKRVPAIITSDDKNFFEFINFTEPSAEEKMIKKERAVTINKMLDLLPEDQREVIILRHYAELSFKDIAFITNCSINTALGRMRYGLANLRKMMEQKQIAI